MSVTAEQVIFWIFAVPLVVTACGVVVSRNPVYAAMNLVAAFFFMAGIYILLVAHLVAFMQILVYAGAVMVLFLFVIMLLSLDEHVVMKEQHRAIQIIGALGVVMLVAVIASAIADVNGGAPAVLSPEFGTVKAVGKVLFTQYLLPFEVTSILLLAAIVGAVVVAKERI
ncbi:NADH-quinone oxidoreductase subunit J [Anaeromyxobacter oryzae]|uniref:NADH-quinone oxidoreductase subunit J n=1 Tax=Anaeromyxobacter oryzae TaxID=2918170 RepID=A0ABM7WV05_9BACT|nr:NADH-quinone oxidoreductase subunit J [Anaeromyxobacter oryzae]BDG03321.1 NADH dehydrogenase subunit J [Anaeromyxobacter oryzae]